MFILDKPYISQFVLKSAEVLKVPVLSTPALLAVADGWHLNLVDDVEAVRLQKMLAVPHIYTNSENSLGWVSQHLDFCDLPKTVEVFKNKVLFRELLRPLYPGFSFSSLQLRKMTLEAVEGIALPCVVKPAVGFFSMGVHKVTAPEQWPSVLAAIRQEMAQVEGLYPTQVMDSTTFVIEEAIEGEEYAIDAYYDRNGKPAILDILQHPFTSDADVSDRVYVTSRRIVRRWRSRFLRLLEQMGGLISLRNFPVHMEVRVGGDGVCMPIEVNPMRFAGWCTTDLAHYAFGQNVYEHYFRQTEPNWAEIEADGSMDSFALVVAEVPSGVDRTGMLKVDWDGLLAEFSAPLEVRPIDTREYPVVAFLFAGFAEGNEGDDELQRILRLNMADFVSAAR